MRPLTIAIGVLLFGPQLVGCQSALPVSSSIATTPQRTAQPWIRAEGDVTCSITVAEGATVQWWQDTSSAPAQESAQTGNEQAIEAGRGARAAVSVTPD